MPQDQDPLVAEVSRQPGVAGPLQGVVLLRHRQHRRPRHDPALNLAEQRVDTLLARPRRQDYAALLFAQMEEQVLRQILLKPAPEPSDALDSVVVQPALVVLVVLPAGAVGSEPQQVVADLYDARRPLGLVVGHPQQQRQMIGCALPVAVILAAVHLHRDLPAAEVLGELAVDLVPLDAPVQYGTVVEVELLREVDLDCRAQMGLLRLPQMLIAPPTRPLAVEQLVQGVAKRPGETLAGLCQALEPAGKVLDKGRRHSGPAVRRAPARGHRPLRVLGQPDGRPPVAVLPEAGSAMHPRARPVHTAGLPPAQQPSNTSTASWIAAAKLQLNPTRHGR